jgi:hypothetical protein
MAEPEGPKSEPATTETGRRSKELAGMAVFWLAATAAFWALGWNPGAPAAMGVLTGIYAAVVAMKR